MIRKAAPPSLTLRVMIAGLICLGHSTCLAADTSRPNVVMIISDDQTYTDFGFMGSDAVKTPRIDRLASQSARYVNGYVPSSVCRPSLATLLTGLYPHEHGIHFNHPPPGGGRLNALSRDEYYAARGAAERLIQSVPTLPRILARAGYDCLQTGKYWEGHYRTAGFTHGMTTGQAAGVDGCWDKRLPDGAIVAHGNGDIGLTVGRTTWRPLFEFLDSHDQPDDAPFLIWYAPVLPHEPHNPPPEFLEEVRADPAVPRHCVEYYATCAWFDHTVGRLIDLIERKGLARNTIFVFVVDNGWTPSANEHPKYPGYSVDKRSKRSPFEAGVRTPILIRWDGHVKPATHGSLVSSVDIVPTILHAVGLGEHAAEMSGIDLSPSARGDEQLPNRPMFGEIYPGDATQLDTPEADVAYRWVRHGDLKLIVPHGHANKPPWRGYLTEPSLFDVRRDPGETVNLSDQTEYAADLARLGQLLDDWWDM